MAGDALEQVAFESRAELRAWLTQHHATSEGVWLISNKQHTGRPSIGYDAIVEEAICFGWIDSLPRKLDRDRSMLRLTPRKPSSNWSRVNKQRAQKLIEDGLMTPAGLAVIEQAKASGQWTALDEVEELSVPEDLADSFTAHPGASEHWEQFPRSARRAILEWILSAKRPETRARRIAETAEKAAVGQRANQWRQPPAA